MIMQTLYTEDSEIELVHQTIIAVIVDDLVSTKQQDFEDIHISQLSPVLNLCWKLKNHPLEKYFEQDLKVEIENLEACKC